MSTSTTTGIKAPEPTDITVHTTLVSKGLSDGRTLTRELDHKASGTVTTVIETAGGTRVTVTVTATGEVTHVIERYSPALDEYLYMTGHRFREPEAGSFTAKAAR